MHHKWPERFCRFGDFAGMITLVPFCPARILLSPAGKWDQDSSTQCATKVFQLIGIYLQYFTEKLFLPKLWPRRNPHLTSARCDVCQVEGCHRNPDLQSKRGGLAVMPCSSESIWKMRKSPKRHGKMRKHVNEPRSDVSLMGSEIGHWVWFEKCQRRGWVFVGSCLTTLLGPLLSSRDRNGDLVQG